MAAARQRHPLPGGHTGSRERRSDELGSLSPALDAGLRAAALHHLEPTMRGKLNGNYIVS